MLCYVMLCYELMTVEMQTTFVTEMHHCESHILKYKERG